ncbi:MAG: hypothetical protein K0U98_05500 [Deltaproteobacteria bacterium]|nr:hypothetical protein [Deltaproteobacteria bacterium]
MNRSRKDSAAVTCLAAGPLAAGRMFAGRVFAGWLLALGGLAIGGLAFGGLAFATDAPQEPSFPDLPVSQIPLGEGLVSTISIDEISRGQRGYGLSVFAGQETERFEVEVLGVLRDSSPQSSAIIARLTGQGLEESGVIAGMSGSPVYIDGRLAGAVAFGWNYSKEAIAGITPIDAMRKLAAVGSLPAMDRSSRDGSSRADFSRNTNSAAVSWAGPAVTLKDLVSGNLPLDLLEKELAKLRPQGSDRGVPGIVWSAGGFGGPSRGLLERSLGTVASAGSLRPLSAGPGVPANAGSGLGRASGLDLSLPPGSPVAAALIRGDLQLAATGTVTDRFGEQVLAFGHPFLGFGPVSLPMAAAEVITVISSTANSFKLSNLGPTVGAFEQDRKVGISGRLNARAPTMPFTLSISGDGIAEPREFHMEMSELRQMLPTLLAVATLGCLDSAGHTTGPQGLNLRARFALEEFGDLLVDQTFDGNNAGNQAAIYLLTFGAMALQTPLQNVDVQRVDVELERSSGERLAKLVGGHAQRTRVRPGETARIYLDLVRFGGERERLSLDVDIPQDLPKGSFYLMIGDGVSSDAARFAIEPGAPVDYQQQLRVLRSLHSRRDLVVLGMVAADGIATDGEVLPQLPGSVRSLWSSASTGSTQALNLAIVRRETRRQEIPLEGMVRVDLEVDHSGSLR